MNHPPSHKPPLLAPSCDSPETRPEKGPRWRRVRPSSSGPQVPLTERQFAKLARSLQVVLRRDPSWDRQETNISLEGYQFLWLDGRPAATCLNALCKHGQRLLNLKRHLADCKECRLELLWVPQQDRERSMTRLSGFRVRRLCLRRQGRQGRIHFLDRTPTILVFDLDHDEEAVLEWVGLRAMRDDEEQWFDLAARPVIAAP